MKKTNNIVSRNLYERAVTEPYVQYWTQYDYDGNVKNIPRLQCIHMEKYNLKICKVSHDYISRYLYFPRMQLEELYPLFIDAQTGSGKTQFIFKMLYPEIHKNGKRLLILVSRSALKTKVKYDAINAAGTEQRDTLTPYGIEREHHFGDIDVFSYQDIKLDKSSDEHKMQLENRMNSYGAVVFDECHYFTADAVFNESTEYTLEYLIKLAHSKRVPRIYMTATPDVVFSSIAEKEKEMFKTGCDTYNCNFVFDPHYMHLFHCERDYSYINLSTFEDDRKHETIIKKISTSNNVKWIIFVHSKDEGILLKTQIERSGKNTIFLSSDTAHKERRENKELDKFLTCLTDKEKMDCDVLITTKYLDVGVTIKDKNVNIVNYLYDKVDFLQSIGRKRVTSGETVYLFIPQYTLSDVIRWRQKTDCKLLEFHKKIREYPEGELVDGGNVVSPLYIKDGRYRHNHLAIQQLEYQKCKLSELVEAIETSNNDTIEITHYFASWMSKCNVLEDDMINLSERDQKLSSIIKPYVGISIDKEQFSALAAALKEFDVRKDKRESRKEMSTQTINTILKPVCYKIKKDVNKETYKIVPIKRGE